MEDPLGGVDPLAVPLSACAPDRSCSVTEGDGLRGLGGGTSLTPSSCSSGSSGARVTGSTQPSPSDAALSAASVSDGSPSTAGTFSVSSLFSSNGRSLRRLGWFWPSGPKTTVHSPAQRDMTATNAPPSHPLSPPGSGGLGLRRRFRRRVLALSLPCRLSSVGVGMGVGVRKSRPRVGRPIASTPAPVPFATCCSGIEPCAGECTGELVTESRGVVRVGEPGRETDRTSGLPDTTLSRMAIEFMVHAVARPWSAQQSLA